MVQKQGKRGSRRGVAWAMLVPLAPLVLLGLGGAGCAARSGGREPVARAGTAGDAASLYVRLGKKKAIRAVVVDFVDRVAADSRINHFFEGIDLKNLRKQLSDQICEAAGGPCKYKGGDMKAVHEGLGIKDSHFDALVEDLVASLRHFQVGQREQDELLGVLGPMRKDVVE